METPLLKGGKTTTYTFVGFAQTTSLLKGAVSTVSYNSITHSKNSPLLGVPSTTSRPGQPLGLDFITPIKPNTIFLGKNKRSKVLQIKESTYN